MSADLQCPYCGEDHEVCHDDGFGCEEDVMHHDECGSCGKRFVFSTSISFYYEPEKADCLNDGEHDYQPMFTVPIECTMMACQMCDDRRKPTEEEMVVIRSEDQLEADDAMRAALMALADCELDEPMINAGWEDDHRN